MSEGRRLPAHVAIPSRAVSLSARSFPLGQFNYSDQQQQQQQQQQQLQPPVRKSVSPSNGSNARGSTDSRAQAGPTDSGVGSFLSPPQANHSRSTSNASNTSSSLPSSTNPLQPLLTIALSNAEHAVKLDGEMRFAEALRAYRETIYSFERVLAKADALDAARTVQPRDSWTLGLPVSQSNEVQRDSVGGGSGTDATTNNGGSVKRKKRRGVMRENERRQLVELRNTYIQRVDVLLANLSPDYSSLYNAPTSSLSRRASYNSAKTYPPIAPTTDNYFETILREDPTTAEPPEPPPSNPERRPFWLMRALSRTITKGGFLTPKLYVPRQIWFQSGARFAALDTKIAACETMMSHLSRLRVTGPGNPQALLKELGEFEAALDLIRRDLGKKLRFIDESGRGTGSGGGGGGNIGGPNGSPVLSPTSDSPQPPLHLSIGNSAMGLYSTSTPNLHISSSSNSLTSLQNPTTPTSSTPSISSTTTSSSRLSTWGSKLSKSMEKLSIQRKSDRVPDSSIYVDTLVRLFDATRMVEEWLEYFEASESGGASGTTRDVVGKLKGVAAFLGSVVCAFVMRDFEVLLERFLKKMRNVAVA